MLCWPATVLNARVGLQRQRSSFCKSKGWNFIKSWTAHLNKLRVTCKWEVLRSRKKKKPSPSKQNWQLFYWSATTRLVHLLLCFANKVVVQIHSKCLKVIILNNNNNMSWFFLAGTCICIAAMFDLTISSLRAHIFTPFTKSCRKSRREKHSKSTNKKKRPKPTWIPIEHLL